jgi:hypothetical protein
MVQEHLIGIEEIGCNGRPGYALEVARDIARPGIGEPPLGPIAMIRELEHPACARLAVDLSRTCGRDGNAAAGTCWAIETDQSPIVGGIDGRANAVLEVADDHALSRRTRGMTFDTGVVAQSIIAASEHEV